MSTGYETGLVVEVMAKRKIPPPDEENVTSYVQFVASHFNDVASPTDI